MFTENLLFDSRVLDVNGIDNLRRANYVEKISAKYLMSRGLEVVREPYFFSAKFVHPIKGGEEQEYKHLPDFAVRNPRRPDAHWAFIEVTSAIQSRLPSKRKVDVFDTNIDVSKVRQFRVMQDYPEVRYVQIGREKVQRWVIKIGLR